MKINIKDGNIIYEKTDAIVNSSSRTLLGGGGVCGKIYEGAGKGLYDECLKLRDTKEYKQGLKEGEAVITSGHKLNAKYIIHTLGTDIRDFKDDSWKELLSNCYTNVLKIAEQYNITSISFPPIGNGTFGLNMKETSIIALNSIKEYFNKNKSNIEIINIIIYNNEKSLDIYISAYKNIF